MIDWEVFKTQMQANPKKILGFVVAIAACFLLIWMLIVLEADTAGEAVAVDQFGRLDSLRISLNQPAGDSLASANTKSTAPYGRDQETTPFANALPTFLILLAAIGGLWYWIKKGSKKAGITATSENDLLRIIDTREVSVGNQLSVIKINNEFWVVGIGNQGPNLLHRYTKDEWDGPDGRDIKDQKTSGHLFDQILKYKQSKEDPGHNGSN